MTKRTICTPSALQVREAADGGESRTIEGYAIVFGVRSLPLWREGGGITAYEVIDREAVTPALLEGSDILMTLYHDNEKPLARSKRGEGSLRYELDERGVRFSFDAPRTADGDAALELVRSGILDGCSFAFSADYFNAACVERSVECHDDGTRDVVYRVKQIDTIYDFTLTPRPAYASTEVEARSLDKAMAEAEARRKAQAKAMRDETKRKLF